MNSGLSRRGLLALLSEFSAFRLEAEVGWLRWMVLDVSGTMCDSSWAEAEAGRGVGMGSLLKPFLALAFLSTHDRAPVVECRGAADGCWQARGHGRQELVGAIANSCNVYFLRLAAGLDRAALDRVCLAYGLSVPARDWTPGRLIGLEGGGWPQMPGVAARAYAGLAREAREVPVQMVLAGMARCAHSGTGRAVHFRCFAKTGTARCCHTRGDAVDGYAVAIYPMDQPRKVVLVMQHGTSGAVAAGAVRRVVGGGVEAGS